jgi:hypothetical protein
MAESHSDRYDVVWPLGPKARATPTGPAERAVLADDRLRIGFIWDYLFHGDEMFDAVREQVLERMPHATFVDYDRFGNVHGHDEAEVIARLPETLRATGVDAVVVAVGA